MTKTITDGDVAAALAHLRDEADFARSWCDGRRIDLGEEYKAVRRAHAEKLERWIASIEKLEADNKSLEHDLYRVMEHYT